MIVLLMAARNRNLGHERATKSGTALLLIDVINDFDFSEASSLLRSAQPMAKKIAALSDRARAAGIPIIYVNDNFGQWRSDFKAQVRHCMREACAGKEIVALLQPHPEDYFVLKPMHSGFYSTTLDLLLDFLKVHTVILTGVAADICVLFTANDAYMRNFKLIVPSDCIASNTVHLKAAALKQMKATLKANVAPSSSLTLAKLRGLKKTA